MACKDSLGDPRARHLTEHRLAVALPFYLLYTLPQPLTEITEARSSFQSPPISLNAQVSDSSGGSGFRKKRFGQSFSTEEIECNLQ